MELFIILGYLALAITVFTLFRIPLNKWTVPTASLGGMVLTFALIQVLNFYHPYAVRSEHQLTLSPESHTGVNQSGKLDITVEDRYVMAWFPQNSLLRLEPGSETEITFDSIPGKVFVGLVQQVLPVAGPGRNQTGYPETLDTSEALIPVRIDITERDYAWYAPKIPNGSRATVAVYGKDLKQLAVVRKTLLRMSAWMNYISPVS